MKSGSDGSSANIHVQLTVHLGDLVGGVITSQYYKESHTIGLLSIQIDKYKKVGVRSRLWHQSLATIKSCKTSHQARLIIFHWSG